jgi:hypothetical protein
MKCEEYQILIEDYVDGALDPNAAARVTSHTASCADCAAFHEAMSRELEVYSRYQRDVEVTPALWASIETRIKHKAEAQPTGLISRLREQLANAFSAPRLSPAFAAALVIVAIGTTVFIMSRLNSSNPVQVAGNNGSAPSQSGSDNNGGSAPAPTAPDTGAGGGLASGPTSPATGTGTVATPGVTPRIRQTTAKLTPAQLVRDAEQKYLTAITMLSRDVNSRRSQLDPMMLARFDASLAEIDRTIKETRHVVRENPEDPIALQYLLAAYSKKVDVLREMTND